MYIVYTFITARVGAPPTPSTSRSELRVRVQASRHARKNRPAEKAGRWGSGRASVLAFVGCMCWCFANVIYVVYPLYIHHISIIYTLYTHLLLDVLVLRQRDAPPGPSPACACLCSGSVLTSARPRPFAEVQAASVCGCVCERLMCPLLCVSGMCLLCVGGGMCLCLCA